MALTDEMNTTMLVSPANSVYGNNNGILGNDGLWLLLVLLLGGGWGGFGGFGMGGAGAMLGMGMADGFGLYPWLNNSQNINDGFRDQALNTTVNGIQNAVVSGFGDVQLGIAGINQNVCQTGAGITNAVNQGFANTNLGMCQGFNGVNNAISGAQNAITQQMYGNEIAALERSFAAQSAATAASTNLSVQLANCCCENRQATADLKYTVATENCADRQALSDGIRDVLAATQAQTQAILDKMCQQELDAERRENNNLRSELMYARGQASQTAQTAAIEASQTAQTQYLINRIAPYPQPAIVYGYNTTWLSNPGTVTGGTTATA